MLSAKIPKLVAAGALILAAAMSLASLPTKPGLSEEQVQFGAENRIYLLQLPPNYDGKKKLPLVMLLHGFTSNSRAIRSYSGFGDVADREGFILVVPQGLGNPTGWNCGFINLGKPGADDLGYLSSLLTSLPNELSIDRNRIYVAGHSNGAFMANALGSMMSSKIAAIASVAGIVGVGSGDKAKLVPSPKDRLNVLFIHGTADNMVAYDSTATALVKGTSAPDGIKWWANSMGIQSAPKVENFSGYSTITYSGQGVRAELATIPNWKHDWPVSNSAPFSGATFIWDFFKRCHK